MLRTRSFFSHLSYFYVLFVPSAIYTDLLNGPVLRESATLSNSTNQPYPFPNSCPLSGKAKQNFSFRKATTNTQYKQSTTDAPLDEGLRVSDHLSLHRPVTHTRDS